MVKEIKEEEFKNSVKEGYSVVDFSATWCGPCQMLAPVLAEVSDDMEGKAKFYSIDVDDAQDLCQKLGVMSVPAVFIFKDGVAVSQSVGFRPKGAIQSWIAESMGI